MTRPFGAVGHVADPLEDRLLTPSRGLLDLGGVAHGVGADRLGLGLRGRDDRAGFLLGLLALLLAHRLRLGLGLAADVLHLGARHLDDVVGGALGRREDR